MQKSAVEYLESFISYEKGSNFDYDEENFDLGRLSTFINEYGINYSQLKFIHVAGSKGKGSVCNMIASYLWKDGKNCGLFTSPHMVSVNERFMFNGSTISEDEFEDVVSRLRKFIDQRKGCDLTYFELTFVIALDWFLNKGCEYVVLEVGLGGRLDATNIVYPEVCALTRVEKEHTDILGNTIEAILDEKMGIKKPGVPMIVGYQGQEVYDVLHGRGELIFAKDVMGDVDDVKIENANLSYLVLKTLLKDVNVDLFSDVLRDFRLVGRQDVRVVDGNTIVLDMAHTKRSMEVLLGFLVKQFSDKEFVFLVSVMKGKSVGDMLQMIGCVAGRVVFTQSYESRGLSAKVLGDAFVGDCEVEEDFDKAFDSVFNDLKKDQVLVLTGSHFLVGKALNKLSLN